MAPDADTNSTADDHNPATYDNEMLDAHFVAGDVVSTRTSPSPRCTRSSTLSTTV